MVQMVTRRHRNTAEEQISYIQEVVLPSYELLQKVHETGKLAGDSICEMIQNLEDTIEALKEFAKSLDKEFNVLNYVSPHRAIL
jgi:methyl-accepting chemotaxis protein